MNYLEQSDCERFWSHVDKKSTDECWNWKNGLTSDGYGKFKAKYKTLIASRVAYYLTYGEYDKSLLVCHKCDNPKCCNPKHLFLGTNKDNLQDCAKKGHLRGMPNGRKLLNVHTGEIYYSVREAKMKIPANYNRIYDSLRNGKDSAGIFLKDVSNAGI